jgi:hypothetical protein
MDSPQILAQGPAIDGKESTHGIVGNQQKSAAARAIPRREIACEPGMPRAQHSEPAPSMRIPPVPWAMAPSGERVVTCKASNTESL